MIAWDIAESTHLVVCENRGLQESPTANEPTQYGEREGCQGRRAHV